MKTVLRRNQIVAVFIVLLVIASLAPCAEAQSEKLGYLRIKAEYPIQVPLSYSFSVKLKIEYAFRDYFEVHAAAYEGPRGTFGRLLWEGEAERLADVGDKTYEVQLKSPSREGSWVLTGYVFFRDASGSHYFTDQERGPGFVEMRIKVADSARLTLRAPHGNMPIYVDGSAYSTDSSGILVREFRVLTEHSVAAPRNVSLADGWRAVFKSWNGTDTMNPNVLLITTDLSLTIDFRDEFYLDLVSNVADVRGAGWYPSGAIANFSAPLLAPSKSWEGMFGVSWRFVSWSGDVESAAPNESMVMDRPHRVIASWVVDYERFFYLMIAGGVVLVVGLAVFLRRRMAAGQAMEAPVASVRTFCMFCGSGIDPDAKFCLKCGRSQVSSG